jgi:hypothetical protein
MINDTKYAGVANRHVSKKDGVHGIWGEREIAVFEDGDRLFAVKLESYSTMLAVN